MGHNPNQVCPCASRWLQVECVQYDFWNCYFPEGLFVAHKEADKYKEEIKRFSPKAYEEFCKVEDELRPLFEAAVGLPTPALRWDPWVVPAVASQADPLALLKSGLVCVPLYTVTFSLLCLAFTTSKEPARGDLLGRNCASAAILHPFAVSEPVCR